MMRDPIESEAARGSARKNFAILGFRAPGSNRAAPAAH
jgi:hypothetical protein